MTKRTSGLTHTNSTDMGKIAKLFTLEPGNAIKNTIVSSVVGLMHNSQWRLVSTNGQDYVHLTPTDASMRNISLFLDGTQAELVQTGINGQTYVTLDLPRLEAAAYLLSQATALALLALFGVVDKASAHSGALGDEK